MGKVRREETDPDEPGAPPGVATLECGCRRGTTKEQRCTLTVGHHDRDRAHAASQELFPRD